MVMLHDLIIGGTAFAQTYASTSGGKFHNGFWSTGSSINYASISSSFVSYVTPLINGSWHYLVIVLAISAGFAIFYYAWHKFRGMVRR